MEKNNNKNNNASQKAKEDFIKELMRLYYKYNKGRNDKNERDKRNEF